MRPRKKVVLLASAEWMREEWVFRLDIWRYRPLAAESLADALEHLELHTDCSLVLVLGRQEDAVLRLKRWVHGRGVQVLVAGVPAAHAFESLADAVVPDCQGMASLVLDKLKILCARKHGPKANGSQSLTRYGVAPEIVKELVEEAA